MKRRAGAIVFVLAAALGALACARSTSAGGSNPPTVDIPSATASGSLPPIAAASASVASSASSSPAGGGECATDADCVPTTCCHPRACGAISQRPSCAGAMCTMECRGGTLDCGGGHCVCQNGSCGTVLTPRRFGPAPAASP